MKKLNSTYEFTERPDLRSPYSIEAERSVLGSVLIEPECIDLLSRVLADRDFYIKEHRRIFRAMLELFYAGITIDTVTLTDELLTLPPEEEDELIFTKEETRSYLTIIADTVPGSNNVKEYARIVRDKACKRRLIEKCSEISELAYSGCYSARELTEYAEQGIYSLLKDDTGNSFESIRDVLVRVSPESFIKDKIDTGFLKVDSILKGIKPGELVLIHGHISLDKLQFALKIAMTSAVKFREEGGKKTVCIFSPGTSKEEVVRRMVRNFAVVDPQNELSDEDKKRMAEQYSELADLNIRIDDSKTLNISELKIKLRNEYCNIGAVIIDCVGCIDGDNVFDRLKSIAKELDRPIICCADTDGNEYCEAAQSTDVEILLKDDGISYTVNVTVTKNRYGDCGTANIGYIGKFGYFNPAP